MTKLPPMIPFLLAASLCSGVMACGKQDAKSDDKKDDKQAKADGEAKPDEAKPDEAEPEAPPAELTLVETDITAAYAKDLPLDKGTLKMNLPEGVTFEPGVGKLRAKKDDFELEIGSGLHVDEKKTKLAESELYKDVKFLEDSETAIVFSANMMGTDAFFTVVNAPAIGGLKCSCETGMAGAKTEALARKVLEACQSTQYTE